MHLLPSLLRLSGTLPRLSQLPLCELPSLGDLSPGGGGRWLMSLRRSSISGRSAEARREGRGVAASGSGASVLGSAVVLRALKSIDSSRPSSSSSSSSESRRTALPCMLVGEPGGVRSMARSISRCSPARSGRGRGEIRAK